MQRKAYDYVSMKVFPKSAINGLTKLLASNRFSKKNPKVDIVKQGMGLQWQNTISRDLDGRTYESCVYHFETPRKITAEQTKLGKAWLKNYFYKLDGKPRTGKRLEDIDEQVLKIANKVTRFEFIGVLSFCNWYGEELAYGPIYRSYDKHGNYFDYTPVHWGQPVITDVVLKPTKFEQLLNEAHEWSKGSDSDGSLEYALANGYGVHAVSLWQNSGASLLPFTVKINRKDEMREINELCESADVVICKDCNHHGFYQKGIVSLDGFTCYGCGSKNVSKDSADKAID